LSRAFRFIFLFSSDIYFTNVFHFLARRLRNCFPQNFKLFDSNAAAVDVCAPTPVNRNTSTSRWSVPCRVPLKLFGSSSSYSWRFIGTGPNVDQNFPILFPFVRRTVRETSLIYVGIVMMMTWRTQGGSLFGWYEFIYDTIVFFSKFKRLFYVRLVLQYQHDLYNIFFGHYVGLYTKWPVKNHVK